MSAGATETMSSMRLAEFIDQQRPQIVAESVKYAAEIPVLSGEALATLRDHLPRVLEAIARDLEQPQTRAQSISKSKGLGPEAASETAAETHGVLRARSGLTVEQLVAEYRVLRSSVLRLWAEAQGRGPHSLDDTLRFNEAVDQAVAESVAFFAEEHQRWRSIFLGVLGHDLRGPLNAMLLTAEVLSRTSQQDEPSGSAKILLRNGRHMQTLLDSLLEYSRSELGVGMAVNRRSVDLAQLCRDEVEMLRTALPGSRIDLAVQGDASGQFDGARVREALANLVFNAAQHGSPGQPAAVLLTGHAKEVELRVENDSEAIPDEVLQNLFEPLRRHATTQDAGRNLGLGLFIVREIARAHGGDVTVAMADGRVSFRMVLPKAAAAG